MISMFWVHDNEEEEGEEVFQASREARV